MFSIDAPDRYMFVVQLGNSNRYIIFPQFSRVKINEQPRFKHDGLHTFFDVAWSVQRPSLVKPAVVTIQNGEIVAGSVKKGELT